MGFLKAVAVITGAWYRTAVSGRRIAINDPAYPDDIALFSGNPDEDSPALISGGAASSNVGSLELRSPVLGSAGYAWLELEGYDDQDPHTTATLSADLVKLEGGDLVRVIGFGTGVHIGSDIGAGNRLVVSGNAVSEADLSDASNVFPSIPYSVAYSGTTDANGFLTVTHGAPFTPVGGWAVTTNPSASFAHFWGIDTIGATTVRLRFANASGAGGLASAAVVGRLFLVRP